MAGPPGGEEAIPFLKVDSSLPDVSSTGHHGETIKELIHEQHLRGELKKAQSMKDGRRRLLFIFVVATLLVSSTLFKVACQYDEVVTDRTVPPVNATYEYVKPHDPPGSVPPGKKKRRRRLGRKPNQKPPTVKLGGGFDSPDLLEPPTTCASTSFPWVFTDALYFAFVTLTSIGYGDFYPTSRITRCYSIAVMLCGMGIVASIMGMIGEDLTNAVGAETDDGDDDDDDDDDDESDAANGDCAEDETTTTANALSMAKFDRREQNAIFALRNTVVRAVMLFNLWVACVLISAVVFSQWIGWTFTDACYFSWYTASTIGFGASLLYYLLRYYPPLLSP